MEIRAAVFPGRQPPDTYAVTGSYPNIAQRIKERYAGLLDRVGLYQPWQTGLTDPRWPALVKAFNG